MASSQRTALPLKEESDSLTWFQVDAGVCSSESSRGMRARDALGGQALILLHLQSGSPASQ